ncbi:hypothetical protein O6H91_Y385300 [Diphasiastrum complanatum]|nr:hypothetical protein O6H91_Y385300 [Diphasiastrum complanatum]
MAILVLNELPQSFHHVLTSVMSCERNSNYQELSGIFVQEGVLISQTKIILLKMLLLFLSIHQEVEEGSDLCQGGSVNNVFKKGPCSFCGTKNHWESECWKKYRALGNSNSNVNSNSNSKKEPCKVGHCEAKCESRQGLECKMKWKR